MTLGSTQPLTEMSTRSISWGKGGRCVRLTTLPPSCGVVVKSGNLNFLETSGPLQACKRTASYFIVYNIGVRYFVTWCPKKIKEFHLKLGKDYFLSGSYQIRRLLSSYLSTPCGVSWCECH